MRRCLTAGVRAALVALSVIPFVLVAPGVHDAYRAAQRADRSSSDARPTAGLSPVEGAFRFHPSNPLQRNQR